MKKWAIWTSLILVTILVAILCTPIEMEFEGSAQKDFYLNKNFKIILEKLKAPKTGTRLIEGKDSRVIAAQVVDRKLEFHRNPLEWSYGRQDLIELKTPEGTNIFDNFITGNPRSVCCLFRLKNPSSTLLNYERITVFIEEDSKTLVMLELKIKVKKSCPIWAIIIGNSMMQKDIQKRLESARENIIDAIEF